MGGSEDNKLMRNLLAMGVESAMLLYFTRGNRDREIWRKENGVCATVTYSMGLTRSSTMDIHQPLYAVAAL